MDFSPGKIMPTASERSTEAFWFAFADHTLGNIADTVADGARHATIQLNTHFLAAVKAGEFLELHAEVTARNRFNGVRARHRFGGAKGCSRR